MEFDGLKPYSEKEYLDFVDWLINQTVFNLRQAKSDGDKIREAIAIYLEKGYKSHITSEELIDFFCVSSPSILDLAGYNEEEADLIIKEFDELNPEIFSKYYK